WDRLMADFAEAHSRQYGFALPGEPVELINIRGTALNRARARYFVHRNRDGGRPMKRRPVWFHPEKPTNCAIHHRAELDGGESLAGPAVIEATESTTLPHPRR